MTIERSKSQSTIKDYSARVVTLAKRTGLETSDPTFNAALMDQLLLEKNKISKATWRKKKASLVWYFTEMGDTDRADELSKIDCSGTLNKATGTSSHKKKSLTIKEEEAIRDLLTLQKTQNVNWGLELLSITECILVTGLRPQEIPNATLYTNASQFFEAGGSLNDYDSGWPMLKIKNAKNTNGRSFGDYRHLDLSEIEDKQLLMIEMAIVITNELKTPKGKAESYEKFYGSMRNAFSRVIKQLPSLKSKSISLYTYRHQCIADLKAEETYTLLDIAAIVGHGNDITATEHYGRRRGGRNRRGLVKPNPIDVRKVKPLLQTKLSKFQHASN